MKIGDNIRSIRQNQKRTLENVATQCGITKSMVSKIETNAISPSMAILAKISKALGVKMTALLEMEASVKPYYLKSEDSMKNIAITETGYRMSPVASEYRDKKMQPFICLAKKGEVKEHLVSHDGDEYVFILEGECRYRVGDIEYSLRVGDSLYFNSVEKHAMMPFSEVVRYINVLA